MTLGYKYVCRLQKQSGVIKDQVVNNFYTDTVTSGATVAAALGTFYSGFSTALSPAMLGFPNGLKIDQYAIPDTRPPVGVGLGPPVASFTEGVSGIPAGTALPSEVSVALSFHAAYATIPEHGPGHTRPRAKYRGRVFLGEWNTTIIHSTSGTQWDAVVDPSLITLLTTAASALMHTSGLGWSVFSKTDWALREVVGGWVDNAFDSTRRRKVPESAKTTWS